MNRCNANKLEALRQLGLVDNEKVDHFLASAFAKTTLSTENLFGNVAAHDDAFHEA